VRSLVRCPPCSGPDCIVPPEPACWTPLVIAMPTFFFLSLRVEPVILMTVPLEFLRPFFVFRPIYVSGLSAILGLSFSRSPVFPQLLAVVHFPIWTLRFFFVSKPQSFETNPNTLFPLALVWFCPFQTFQPFRLCLLESLVWCSALCPLFLRLEGFPPRAVSPTSGFHFGFFSDPRPGFDTFLSIDVLKSGGVLPQGRAFTVFPRFGASPPIWRSHLSQSPSRKLHQPR